jgi:hypothetical protein
MFALVIAAKLALVGAIRSLITSGLFSCGSATSVLGNTTGAGPVTTLTLASGSTFLTAISEGRGNAGCATGIGTDGKLYGWGGSEYGENGTGGSTSTPTVADSATTYTACAAGFYNSVSIKAGQAMTCGFGYYGACGSGGTSNQTTPYATGLTGVVSVGTCHPATHAVKSNGTLWGTGARYTNASLGDGSTASTQSNVFIQLGSDTDWVSVFDGYLARFAIKSNGKLYGWGSQQDGAMGNGVSSGILTSPTLLDGSAWSIVRTQMGVSSHNSSIGIKSNGTLWVCGSNLEDVTNTNVQKLPGVGGTGTSVWTQVGSATNWIDCGVSGDAVVALNSAGELWVCGQNFSGELSGVCWVGMNTGGVLSRITSSTGYAAFAFSGGLGAPGTMLSSK